MRVEISKRAQRSIERIDVRWRKQADYPEIFRTEMDEVIDHLVTVNGIQVWDGRREHQPRL